MNKFKIHSKFMPAPLAAATRNPAPANGCTHLMSSQTPKNTINSRYCLGGLPA